MSKLINNSQVKVIEEVFNSPGINLREIIRKTGLSPNYVSNYVNLLTKKDALKEERLEKNGRAYLRRFFINFKSSIARNIYMIVKEEKKETFFRKYPKLRPIFNQIIKEIKGIEFVLVYGSYSRLAAEKESDIDIMIVGKIKNKEKIREILVSLNIEVSINIETLDNF
ncbi:MAG TPA: nucleotidyltransferase domain-containing protein, partial [Candidatus Nanoarchaeia archaeon]|nr:nucleotidyltransferase domain-containing protein [Candidatus Nanoarchaeia archaeon]